MIEIETVPLWSVLAVDPWSIWAIGTVPDRTIELRGASTRDVCSRSRSTVALRMMRCAGSGPCFASRVHIIKHTHLYISTSNTPVPSRKTAGHHPPPRGRTWPQQLQSFGDKITDFWTSNEA